MTDIELDVKATREPDRSEEARLRAEIAKLQAFKDWVHAYLDGKGVPAEVQDEHLAAGCRIGGRLNWVFAEIRRIKTLVTDGANGDFWAWQGDGSDNLETLVCPVLIPAKELLKLIGR